MSTSRLVHAAAAAILFSLTPVAAQVPGAAPSSAQQAAALRSIYTFAPATTTSIEGPNTALIFSSEKGSSAVEAKLGSVVAGQALTFTVATPLDKNNPETKIAGLDGLTHGTKMSLAMTGLLVGDRIDARNVVSWCKTQLKRGSIPAGFNCESFQRNQLPEELRDDFDARGVFAQGATLWGLSSALTRGVFEYLEGHALNERKDTEWGFDFGGAVGRSTWAGLVYAGAGYQRTHKAATAGQLCTPVDETTTALQCKEARFSAPTEAEGPYAKVGLRRYVGSWLATSPQLTYSEAKEEWSLAAPLYFLPGKGGLIGGISPRWNSTDDDLTIVLFVGSAFGVTLP